MREIGSYNPFNKSLSEINANDLSLLKSVHEGWYVDYKGGPLKSRDYAKAISAMANTYGGWIFIGVEEESRNNNVAGAFPGIPQDQIDSTHQRIRQAVAEHLSPQPFFELRAVDSPGDGNANRIVCINVPASPKAPIIHSDGRIYRRINDSSEPVPENKRDAVDHLIQRSEKIARRYKNWHRKDPELSRAEKGISILRVLAVPDYWEEKDLWYEGSSEEFRNLIRSKLEGTYFSVNYNHIYTNIGGFVCRAVQNKDARQISQSLIVQRDLRNEIWFPIPSFEFDQYHAYQQGTEALEQLKDYLVERGFSGCKALDFNRVFSAIDAFFVLQQKLEKSLGYDGSTLVKFKLTNVWRCIPVIDASPTELHWDDYGVPMILEDEIKTPHGGKPENFLSINLHDEPRVEPDKKSPHFMMSGPVFINIMLACGMGAGNFKDFSETIVKAAMSSFEKAERLPD